MPKEAKQKPKKKQTVYTQVVKEGGGTVARQGLGEMPLTLWVIVAAVVLYFYIRRARLGIDKHPAERPAIRAPAPKPTVRLQPSVTPYAGGADVYSPN